MGKRKNIAEFIKEANRVHKGKYDYSKVEYKDNRTKVCIICPEHGEFWQSPYKHLIGQGCPMCSKTMNKTSELFIKDAIEIHRNKYDYSKVNYTNNKEKVCIVCPVHGEFWQTPHNHLKGQGCPECAKNLCHPTKKTTASFIKNAISVWGNRYDYSKVEYLSAKDKVCVICPMHGEFWQEAESHLQGCGCPKCGAIANGFNKRLTNEEFISKARDIHKDKYDYSKVEYFTAKHKVCIICPKHDEFWQSPWHHLNGCGCPKCANTTSKPELEIYEYICGFVGKENVEQHNRTILNGKELDIYIPSMKVAIEYNGLYWHTENTVGNNYHYDKMIECNAKGIRLIQIFEDEYVNHKDIVLKKLSHILHIDNNLPKVMGRKCSIKEIETVEAKAFLEVNHIQGFGVGSVYLGAFYNDALIAVMAFKQECRKWELTRFASDNNLVCQGVGGKLFSYFIKHYKPTYIKSFADRRWTTNENNNLYTKLGFIREKYTTPDYRYYKPQDGKERQHKFSFRKSTLHKKYGLPLAMTETEMTEQLGYHKIYDCGLIKYVWKKS